MATIDELNDLIWYAQNKINQCRKTIEDCDEKINRLKPVYQKLGEIKSDFHNVKEQTEQIFKEKCMWRGKKYSDFVAGGTILDNACDDYYRSLDAAQDEVNKIIGELESEKAQVVPIIGKLLGQIAQWRVDLQNARN